MPGGARRVATSDNILVQMFLTLLWSNDAAERAVHPKEKGYMFFPFPLLAVGQFPHRLFGRGSLWRYQL